LESKKRKNRRKRKKILTKGEKVEMALCKTIMKIQIIIKMELHSLSNHIKAQQLIQILSSHLTISSRSLKILKLPVKLPRLPTEMIRD
jgi:hypothetical protein